MVLRITKTRESIEEHRRNMWVRCGRIREVVNSDGVGRLGEVWITNGKNDLASSVIAWHGVNPLCGRTEEA